MNILRFEQFIRYSSLFISKHRIDILKEKGKLELTDNIAYTALGIANKCLELQEFIHGDFTQQFLKRSKV